jgi:hypothetical protein
MAAAPCKQSKWKANRDQNNQRALNILAGDILTGYAWRH